MLWSNVLFKYFYTYLSRMIKKSFSCLLQLTLIFRVLLFLLYDLIYVQHIAPYVLTPVCLLPFAKWHCLESPFAIWRMSQYHLLPNDHDVLFKVHFPHVSPYCVCDFPVLSFHMQLVFIWPEQLFHFKMIHSIFLPQSP